MSTVDDPTPATPGLLHWLSEDETETLKEATGEGTLPRYLLPERSMIEEQINRLRSDYIVPVDREAELDRLVFAYNTAAGAALAATKRWQTQRGSQGRHVAHALLYVEVPEVVACVESLQELERAGRTLFEFLSGLQPKGPHRLPDFMKQWDRIGSEPRRFDRY